MSYQNVRSNKDPSGRGVSNSVTAAQATNAGGYGTISKRTDVYGIGATLYYAITGQQPGHSLKDVRPITSYKLKFSRSFLLIIARAMMKRQEEKTMCADAYETSQAEIASYTSIGTRKSQQDSICFDFGDFCTVCAVCDGMGGLTGGERASALAAHGVTRYLLEHAQAEDIPTEMGRAALRLNEEVKNLRDPANQKIEAGTTLTTVFLRNGKLFWCSIGDSHIYLYRDGTLEQLNIDHNFGAQLDQMALEGSITQDEALHHPQRAALTSYLGISELTLISGNRMPFQLRKGDVLIQCTDGLYRYLPDSTMCRILAVTGNLKQAAEQMVKTALAVPGGHDNTSVLLARYKG